MSVAAAKLASDLMSCVGKGNTYGKPEVINLAKLQKGKQKVMCAGFVKAALPSLYNGTNTIWRGGYLTEHGSISDHKSTNGYPKDVNPRKSSQLEVGMAVFKWQKTGEPSKYSKDGKGNYCHIGIVASVSPLKIVHCSSQANGVKVDTSIGKWCAWGYLKNVSYAAKAADDKVDTTNDKEGDDTMLYQAQVHGGLLNVRKQPSKSATAVGQLKSGTVVEVYETHGDWSRVAYGSTAGWCMSKYLKRIAGTEQDEQTEQTEQSEEAESEQETQSVNLKAVAAALEELAARVSDLEEQLELLRGD